jgi:antirestriction protein ArdC
VFFATLWPELKACAFCGAPVSFEEKQVMRNDVSRRVTDSIIAELEHGVGSWLKPWNEKRGGQDGINILMLWAEAVEKGFAAPIWMTFGQAASGRVLF